ncbi:MAG TPA: CPBP family intramembrane glutamic endopeptidase [Puia sp.]|nr:CPBP family intramembrane glutamic endopeptidase [Puia sp.]
MTDQTIKNPRIKPGWLRVILFGLGFIIITLLISIPAAIGLFFSNLDQLRADPTHAIASLLQGSHLWEMVLLEFIVSIITVWVFRRYIDRKSISSLGLQLSGFTQESVIGFFTGPALMGLLALLLMASGRLQWVDITFDPSNLFISLGMVVLIAFSEELVFRGYVLSNLLESFSGETTGLPAKGPSSNTGAGRWIALLLSALCFAIFHFSGPGLTPLAFANLFLAGILLGVNYIYTRNLWFSFFLHLSWNFFLGPILGSHVSGLNMPTLLVTEIKGDWLVTGGDFGIEGSILNTALSLIAILILTLAFERKYSPAAPREVAPSKA